MLLLRSDLLYSTQFSSRIGYPQSTIFLQGERPSFTPIQKLTITTCSRYERGRQNIINGMLWTLFGKADQWRWPFWDIAPCRLVSEVRTACIMNYSWPWSWRQYAPLKRRYTSTWLHDTRRRANLPLLCLMTSSASDNRVCALASTKTVVRLSNEKYKRKWAYSVLPYLQQTFWDLLANKRVTAQQTENNASPSWPLSTLLPSGKATCELHTADQHDRATTDRQAIVTATCNQRPDNNTTAPRSPNETMFCTELWGSPYRTAVCKVRTTLRELQYKYETC
jgi:hypothetical protein